MEHIQPNPLRHSQPGRAITQWLHSGHTLIMLILMNHDFFHFQMFYDLQAGNKDCFAGKKGNSITESLPASYQFLKV
jgi:hypothetical protein